MARVAFPLVLQNPVTGSALVGATATITKHIIGESLGSGAEAEIFLTDSESTKVSGNKIVTDNTGRWTQGEGASPAYAQYWLPQGTYDILISGSGLSAVYVTRELVSGFSATERAPLNLVSHISNFTMTAGEFAEMSGTITGTTPPSPAVNELIGAICISGTATLQGASGATFYGAFVNNASSIVLLKYQWVWLQFDGSNFAIVAGEPKNTNKYAAHSFTKAELEAEIEVSASRAAAVSITSGGPVNIGGVAVGSSFILPAGEKMGASPGAAAGTYSARLL